MLLVPALHIIISTQQGKTIEFTSAADIDIHAGIFSAVNTAKVIIPATARLKKEGNVITESAETAKQFAAGDRIEIKMGYGDDLRTEFKGFVRRIDFSTPCEIECEGYSYQLKRTDSFFKEYKKTALKTVLNDIISGTDIVLHPDTNTATLDHLMVDGKNALEALEKLKDNTGFIAYFINHNQLYVGLKYLGLKSSEVKYRLGWNTIKDNQLKYRAAEDQKVYYNVSYQDEKGKEHHFSFGKKGGETFNYKLGFAASHDAAKLIASIKSSNHIYEGYEGNIQTFLIPYAEAGMKGIILDDNYKEREGSYIITDVRVRLNRSGGRRTVTIGPSVSFINNNKV